MLEVQITAKKMYSDEKHIDELCEIITKAIQLSENSKYDIENIHELGEGWVAEETYLGYGAIDGEWLEKLELTDVIDEIATDLCHGYMMTEGNHYWDEA